jgi:AFG3 family protein
MKDIKDNKSDSPKPIRKILNKKTPPKPPKFNIMWLYGIVILAFLLVPTLISGGSGTPTTFKEVDAMLKQNDVEKLVAYKNGDLVVAEVYIKKEQFRPKLAIRQSLGKEQRLFSTLY